MSSNSNLFSVGDSVILITPENSRLDGQPGLITHVTDWGAFVNVSAAATGEFRALFNEMVHTNRNPSNSRSTAKLGGYTGDICSICGSIRMRRNGTCLLCEECGSTSGCS